eukprot:3623047-Prymnesium_polylepis.1
MRSARCRRRHLWSRSLREQGRGSAASHNSTLVRIGLHAEPWQVHSSLAEQQPRAPAAANEQRAATSSLLVLCDRPGYRATAKTVELARTFWGCGGQEATHRGAQSEMERGKGQHYRWIAIRQLSWL